MLHTHLAATQQSLATTVLLEGDIKAHEAYVVCVPAP